MMHGTLAKILLPVTPPPLRTSHFCYRVFWTAAINGRMYGNLAGLEMCAGDKVMWYTFGLGTEVDIHGVYFEGNTFKKQSTTRDTLNLFPHTTAAVSMQPNEPGWSDYITYARADPSPPPFSAIRDDETRIGLILPCPHRCVRGELQGNGPLLRRHEAAVQGDPLSPEGVQARAHAPHQGRAVFYQRRGNRVGLLTAEGLGAGTVPNHRRRQVSVTGVDVIHLWLQLFDGGSLWASVFQPRQRVSGEGKRPDRLTLQEGGVSRIHRRDLHRAEGPPAALGNSGCRWT